jgi:hypothetical protein
MTVESATYVSQLNAAYPAAGDNISEGDDHIRLVKSVLQAQFPSLATTAISQSSAQMNKLGFETGTIVMWASGTTPTTATISGIYFPVGVGSGFSLGTAVSASAAAGSAVLKVQPINFIIKT